MHTAARAALSSIVLALTACAEPPPPQAPEPPPAAPAAPTPSAPAPDSTAAPAASAGVTCASPAACVARGKEAITAKDLNLAARYFAKACDAGDGSACTDAAQALVDRPEGAKGHEILPFLEKGCAAGAATACNGYGQVAHKGNQDALAADWFKKGCLLGSGPACLNLASLLQSGAVPRDDKLLFAARKQGCDLGVAELCEPAAAAPGGVPDKIPGANLSVGSMDVDGVRLEGLSCKMDGVGLLGTMVIAGTLAKQKNALRACGVKAPVPVSWTISRSKVIEAAASTGDKKRDACVVKALQQIRSTDDGSCRAKVGLK